MNKEMDFHEACKRLDEFKSQSNCKVDFLLCDEMPESIMKFRKASLRRREKYKIKTKEPPKN